MPFPFLLFFFWVDYPVGELEGISLDRGDVFFLPPQGEWSRAPLFFLPRRRRQRTPFEGPFLGRWGLGPVFFLSFSSRPDQRASCLTPFLPFPCQMALFFFSSQSRGPASLRSDPALFSRETFKSGLSDAVLYMGFIFLLSRKRESGFPFSRGKDLSMLKGKVASPPFSPVKGFFPPLRSERASGCLPPAVEVRFVLFSCREPGFHFFKPTILSFPFGDKTF